MKDSEPSVEKLADQLICIYLIAIDDGRTPDREELFRNHPQVTEQLRTFFHDLDQTPDMLTKAFQEVEQC